VAADIESTRLSRWRAESAKATRATSVTLSRTKRIRNDMDLFKYRAQRNAMVSGRNEQNDDACCAP
jgi:hypothetical protein